MVGSPHAASEHAEGLAASIGEHGVEELVTLHRHGVSDDELRELHDDDAYVFPNERQTWGLAPLEALAGGTPVVLSTGAGVHEVLQDRPGVWTVPPRDPPAIAGALRQVFAGSSR